MEKLLLSLAIGIGAGLLDILPMLAQKMKGRAVVSAFLQYLFVAVVILNTSLPGPWWLKSPLISLALSLPVIIIVSEGDRKTIPIIGGMALVLGFLIGLAGQFLA